MNRTKIPWAEADVQSVDVTLLPDAIAAEHRAAVKALEGICKT